MNKLMVTAVAAIFALALNAEISSSNIVGYKHTNLRNSLTFFVPSFIDVGCDPDNEGSDLTKLIPGGDYGSGEIIVSELDNVGRNIKDYIYKMNLIQGTWGWYDDVAEEWIGEGDVFFAPGEGFSIDSYAGLTLGAAGEVSTKSRQIPLKNSLTFTGNMAATPLDLTAIIPGGDYGSGEIIVSELDNVGRNTKDYIFKMNLVQGTWGWYDDVAEEWIKEGDVVFEPGEGFSIDSYEGLNVTIPGTAL